MGTDYLDIEFCFDYDDKLTILQVRPIAAHQNWKSTPDHLIFEQSRNIAMQYEALNIVPTGAMRKKTLFGVMPDWNPAEIVGITPRPLAISLYEFLITDATWSVARHSMGYQDLRGYPLVVQIGGRPYVNINLSLNSFIPASLDNRIRSKIVSRQLEKLIERPDLHDKIEFDIAITCLILTKVPEEAF